MTAFPTSTVTQNIINYNLAAVKRINWYQLALEAERKAHQAQADGLMLAAAEYFGQAVVLRSRAAGLAEPSGR
jgi:hypothetical protein